LSQECIEPDERTERIFEGILLFLIQSFEAIAGWVNEGV